MNRQPLLTAPVSQTTWQGIFNNPRPVTVETLSTGKLDIPLSGAANLKHERAAGIKNKRLKVPVFCHLIQHPHYGDYLIDAGLDRSYRRKPYGRVKGLAVRFVIGRATQQEGQDALSGLEIRGARPKGVFFTHLHFDHVAGAVDLPPDVALVASAHEQLRSKGMMFRLEHLDGVETLYTFDFSKGTDLPPFGRSIDILGDGSLWALPTPGHTPGHVSYLVNGLAGPVLITGDACSFAWCLEKRLGPGTYCADIKQAQATLDNIADFAVEHSGLRILYGHDPANLSMVL